jgi:hypothetical protein
MSELDKELEAINKIIKALESLEVDEKKRVIEYTLTRLGLKVAFNKIANNNLLENDLFPPEVKDDFLQPKSNQDIIRDIRSLAQEKSPKTAIEMAVVVAFYLSELAPSKERKEIISTEDITKYFKQASFKLPRGTSGGAATLRNAKNAGLLDSAGETGKYKLNPVGYNLVAFSLPKSGTIRKRKKKINKKKTIKKS